MPDRDFMVGIATALLDVVEPLEEALVSTDAFDALLLQHGWQPPSDESYLPRVTAVFNLTDDVQNAVALLDEVVAAEDVSIANVGAALAAVLAIIGRIRSFVDAPV